MRKLISFRVTPYSSAASLAANPLRTTESAASSGTNTEGQVILAATARPRAGPDRLSQFLGEEVEVLHRFHAAVPITHSLYIHSLV